MWQYDSSVRSIFNLPKHASNTMHRFAYTGEYLTSYSFGVSSLALHALPPLTRLIVLLEGIKFPC